MGEKYSLPAYPYAGEDVEICCAILSNSHDKIIVHGAMPLEGSGGLRPVFTTFSFQTLQWTKLFDANTFPSDDVFPNDVLNGQLCLFGGKICLVDVEYTSGGVCDYQAVIKYFDSVTLKPTVFKRKLPAPYPDQGQDTFYYLS